MGYYNPHEDDHYASAIAVVKGMAFADQVVDELRNGNYSRDESLASLIAFLKDEEGCRNFEFYRRQVPTWSPVKEKHT